MKSWLRHHLHALMETLWRFRRAPLGNTLNVIVFGIALSLPAGFYISLLSIQNFSQGLSGEPELSVFLDIKANNDDSSAIKAMLEQRVQIKNIKFIPRDQAFKELKKGAGLSGVAESLSENPLPDAFIVQVKSEPATNLESLRDEIQKWPQVAHVQVDSIWVKRLAAALSLGKTIALLLASILSFGLVAITFNTVRLQILTQKDEIEVAKLIGAAHPFIRRPFLYHGAILGLVGGAVSWLIVVSCTSVINYYLNGFAVLYPSMIYFNYPSLADTISLLVFSSWLGWLGAWLCVTRHLWRFGSVDLIERAS